jgi:hypothetical protein
MIYLKHFNEWLSLDNIQNIEDIVHNYSQMYVCFYVHYFNGASEQKFIIEYYNPANSSFKNGLNDFDTVFKKIQETRNTIIKERINNKYQI